MAQNRESGSRANANGRRIARLVADILGFTLGATSNEGVYGGRLVVVKSARVGNAFFGITNSMLRRVQDIVLARETNLGTFDLIIVALDAFCKTGWPRGKVTNFHVDRVIPLGKRIGQLTLPL